MPASKRRRRTILPTELLFLVAVAVTFCVVYVAALNLHEIMLRHSGGSGGSLLAGWSVLDDKSVLAARSVPGETVLDGKPGPDGASGGSGRVSGGTVNQGRTAQARPQDETPPPTHLSAYSQVYVEREISLLGDDVSNTGLEAVKHTDEWKTAANWDQDFVRMNQTFNSEMDPPLPQFVNPFELPAFPIPAVKVPASPACCAAP
jgi:hypothetical protein